MTCSEKLIERHSNLKHTVVSNRQIVKTPSIVVTLCVLLWFTLVSRGPKFNFSVINIKINTLKITVYINFAILVLREIIFVE